MGYGIAGHLGLGKETSWGTAVSVTDYVKLLNENVALALDRYDTANIIGALAEPDDIAGINRVEGSIEFAGHPVSLGYFLKSAFVQSSVTVVGSFLHRTQFWTPTADFSSGEAAGTPYTLEIFRDVTSSHRYTGAMVNQLTLGFAPNQDVRCTATILAKAASVVAKTTPTFPGSPSAPFTFDTASISLAGAASAKFEALQVVINNQLEGIPVLNASNLVARILRRGPQQVNLSGTLSFSDLTEYASFVAQTEQALVVNVTRADSFALTVDVPRAVFTAYPVGLRGRERMTVDFEAKAFYHTGSATAINVKLTTVKSDY